MHTRLTSPQFRVLALVATLICTLLIHSVVLAELQNTSLSWGPTGTGHTWYGEDQYGDYADADTASSSSVYYQHLISRAWSASGGYHIIDSRSASTMNGTYVQMAGTIILPWTGYVTTQHYWQGASAPTNLRHWLYTSDHGYASSAACWEGTGSC